MNFDHTNVNFFDGLPDHVLLLVFNKVYDVKALSFAMCVNKRFRSIIPAVDSVFISIPNQNVLLGNSSSLKRTSLLKNLLSRVIVKPLNFLLGFLKSQKGSSYVSSSSSESGCFLPHKVLKPFKSLRKLEIKLPKSDFEIKGSNLLKWKAEFGSQIKSCVLVGATSISNTDFEEDLQQGAEQVRNQDLLDVSEDGFKTRIIWSLSCLIAASARHVLVKKTLKQHELTEHLEIRDESNQGLVSMNKEQIQEFKKSKISGENEEGFLLEKSKVPSLRMKMWYVPVLKLPSSGTVMKGATLVIIKPVMGWKKTEEYDGSWVAEVSDHGGDGEEENGEVFGEAVKELMKKEKTCTLEMNSF